MSHPDIPAMMSSVGAPVGATPSSAPVAPPSLASSSQSDFTPPSPVAPSESVTAHVTIYSTPLASIPPTTPSSALLPPSATPGAFSDNNMGDNTANSSTSFPIGLIAGIVTGFSILILVMGVMFCLLWRHKRIRVVGDDEVTEMRDRRCAMRAYYKPQPPSSSAQRMLGGGSGGGRGGGGDDAESPARSLRAPVDAVTPQRGAARSLRGVAISSPSDSLDVNKPWPPVPLLPGEGATGLTMRASYLIGAPAFNHPDPLRVNEPNMPASYHVWPLDPSKAEPVVSPAQDAFPSREAIKEPHAIRNNVSYGSHQRFNSSLLGRAGSLSQSPLYALSPPPRRRPKSKAHSEATAAGQGRGGRISGAPGLRLSGCGADMREEFLQGEERAAVSDRATWYGDGHVNRSAYHRNPHRRFSQ